MKRKFIWVMLAIISILGFNTKVNAATAPKTITTGSLYTMKEYISGLTIYGKGLKDNSAYVYCEVANKKFPANATMSLGGEVSKGFVYILNNRPNTSDANYNYYVTQTAVWWYKDIITNSNNNLSATLKNTMINNRGSVAIYNAIYNLVQNAKSYAENKGTIILTTTGKFTLSNGKYVSDPIYLTSKELTNHNIELVGAPYGSYTINVNINSAHNGSFQVVVPASSIREGATANFSVKASGSYNSNAVYDYTYGTNYQSVIYGKVFTTPYSIYSTVNLSINRPSADYNELRISKVDENDYFVKNAKLALYEGNCLNSTCRNSDLYASWITSTKAEVFENVPTGTYTLVELEAPNGYRLASKMTVKVTSVNGTYSYTMVDYTEDEETRVRISKTDLTGSKEIAGATLVLRDSSNRIVSSWVSTTQAKYIDLEEGVYSLEETIAPAGYKLSTTKIVFMVDSDGRIYEKNSNGKYTRVDYIKMVNSLKDVVNVNKLDSETNGFVSGAILMVKNLKGETITSWTTTNEAYYLSLDAGEYILTEEGAPEGYVLNGTPIYFKITEEGQLMVKNSNGVYVNASNVVMYNTKEKEEVEIVEVPKTGISSALTYAIGFGVLSSGAFVLLKNGKKY